MCDKNHLQVADNLILIF